MYRWLLTYRHFHMQLLPAMHALGILSLPAHCPALLFHIPIYCGCSSHGHSVGCGCGWAVAGLWPFLSPTAVSPVQSQQVQLVSTAVVLKPSGTEESPGTFKNIQVPGPYHRSVNMWRGSLILVFKETFPGNSHSSLPCNLSPYPVFSSALISDASSPSS